MRLLLVSLLSFFVLSCHSLLFNEKSDSYYHWRVKLNFDEIFDGTDVKRLKCYFYSDDGQGIINEIKSSGIDIESSGYEGINMLNWAVGAKRYEVVEALLKNGADPDYLNNIGVGNLSISVLFKDERMIRLLAVNGANMQRSPDRYTLKDAITSHGTELLTLLIELGSDPDYFDAIGNPLSHAISIDDNAAALKLLDLGASPVSSKIEEEYFRRDFHKWPFGQKVNPSSFRYETDLYGVLYQRMIEFGVAEPNEAHNQWLIEQGREPNL
jgi:ankyrin repeat protein